MEKFEELEKIQQLKESGAITQAEFEVEKQKILNLKEKAKGKMHKSKLFFLLTKILLVITMIFIVITCWWHNVPYQESEENFHNTREDYENGEISESRFEQVKDKYWYNVDIKDCLIYSSCAFGGISTILFVTAITLKIKEKRNAKFVSKTETIITASIIIIVIILTLIITFPVMYNINKNEREKDWKDWREEYQEQDEEKNTLKLTSEMIEDIKEEIESGRLARFVPVVIELSTQQGNSNELNDIEVEVTRHKQTDAYTYTAYIEISWKDNYNKEYYDNSTVTYTAIEEYDDISNKNYTINKEYGFLQ